MPRCLLVLVENPCGIKLYIRVNPRDPLIVVLRGNNPRNTCAMPGNILINHRDLIFTRDKVLSHVHIDILGVIKARFPQLT